MSGQEELDFTDMFEWDEEEQRHVDGGHRYRGNGRKTSDRQQTMDPRCAACKANMPEIELLNAE